MTTPKNPLRICMAMLATNGGSSIVAQEVGQGLVDGVGFDSAAHQGFDVQYCHLRADQMQPNHHLVDAGPGDKTSSLLDIPGSLNGGMDSVSELLRIDERWPFGLLHLHNLQVFGLSALVLKQLRNVPYVITCHGSDILNPHLFDQNREVAISVLRGAAAVTCVSNYMADLLQQKVPELNNIHVIHNFVRASWRDVDFPCRVQPHRFLHISSMRPVKRPELLLCAFSLVQRRLPDAELAIVTTSAGMKRVKQMMHDGLHDGRGLQVIDGDLFPEALNEQYAKAQAMVLTSQFEGFGLVVLEALQHHVPVVAPAVGALPEVLGPDWPYLVIEQDETKLAASIADAMVLVTTTSDDNLQCRIKQTVARFNGPQQIAQYAALYRDILNSTNRSNSCQHY